MAKSRVNRYELEARLSRRLRELDDDTLEQLDMLTRQDSPSSAAAPSQAGLTRRQLFGRLMVGGVVLTTTHVGVTRWGFDQGQSLGVTTARAQMGMEVIKLRGLLALYEQLERVGLDALIYAAMTGLSLPLQGVKASAQVLGNGIRLVDNILGRFEAAIPQILSGLRVAEGLVNNLSERLQKLEALVNQVVERTKPLTEAVDEFVSMILDRIPFGFGQRIRDTARQMGEVVGILPNSVALLQSRLISPLRASWFAEAEEENVQGRLFDPVRTQLLSPAYELLSELTNFLQQWETKLVAPLQEALEKRKEIREQIAAYRRENDLS